MKDLPNGFRITTSLMALALGGFAIATILAEALTPRTPYFSRDLAPPDPVSYRPLAERAAAAALRGDLLADIAMARAAALNIGNEPATPQWLATRERTLGLARQSLSFAPHASRVWLLLGLLVSQGQDQNSVAEILKMSYLTSRADANLIPARLALVAASTAMADAASSPFTLSPLASGETTGR